MEEKSVVMIPFVAHESAMQRMERANKRLFILLIVLIVSVLIYLLVPSDISNVSQEAEADNESHIEQKVGD